MSGELAVRESVPFAEHEVLRGKHENLLRKHETLLETLEDLKKKQREAVAVKEEVEKWEKNYVELQKKLEKVEEDVKDLMSSDDSGAAAPAEDAGVIEISSDDEANERENSGGHSNSQNQEKESFYL